MLDVNAVSLKTIMMVIIIYNVYCNKFNFVHFCKNVRHEKKKNSGKATSNTVENNLNNIRFLNKSIDIFTNIEIIMKILSSYCLLAFATEGSEFDKRKITSCESLLAKPSATNSPPIASAGCSF